MLSKIEIKPLQGVNDVEFGISVSELVAQLGEPDQIEDLTEDGDNQNIEMLNYEKAKISFFCEGIDELILNSCDTENVNATIFGEMIFKMKEKEIVDLFAKHDFDDLETENEEWGETRISFNDALVDLYFIENQLISITWGIPFGE